MTLQKYSLYFIFDYYIRNVPDISKNNAYIKL